MQDIEVVKKDLKGILSPKRYEHSIRVMKKAIKLAKIYSVDINKTALAAVAHDIAKEMDKKEMLIYINNNSINADQIEKNQPNLLHGAIGADICKKKYGFTEDMARAIDIHTTGDVNMNTLDKIIFLADKIEKGREYSSVEEIREASLKDLDEALLLFLNHHIERMLQKGKIIHPKSILFRNELIMKNKE